MNAFIRLLYALFLAAVATTFIGLTIFTFYQPPKGPAYPAYSPNTAQYGTAEYQRQENEHNVQHKRYQQEQDTHKEKMKHYQRIVTIALLPLVAVVLVAGLWLFERSEVLGEGIALGAVFISIYAIITASIADSRVLRFLAVTLLLASTLLLTYRRSIAKDSKA